MNIPSSEELLKKIMVTINVAWRNNLDYSTINNWLANFSGEALGNKQLEQNLALWLLYNFTYFNEEEIKHLCKLILRKFLHSTLKNNIITMEYIKEVLKNTHFLPLGKSSESGAYVLYMFRQENDLPVMFFNENSSLDNDNNIVFVDDVTLSGTQALRNIRHIKYTGYKFTELDVEDGFFSTLQEKKGDKFNEYIYNQIYDKNMSKIEIVNTLNECIIKNKNFYNDIHNFFDVACLPDVAHDLVKIYNENKNQMSNIMIYKMNRIILETYYDGYLCKGINNLNAKNWYLLSFIASKKAKERLETEGVRVITCIELDEMAEAFSDKSMTFYGYPKEKELCKKMCQHYGKKIKKAYPLGYNDCQYLFGLYYTIPNNTLPIFWGTDQWNPLFIRHEKNYEGEIKDVFGKYI